MPQKPTKLCQIALYQPDIAQNLGAVMRLCACFGLKLHIIEPCGFPLDDKRIRRSAMDYIDHVNWQRHSSWQAFYIWAQTEQSRLLLLTTKTDRPYTGIVYQDGDILLLGRESAGAPPEVHDAVDERITIPMTGDVRSLNLAMCAAIVAGEVVRQLSS